MSAQLPAPAAACGAPTAWAQIEADPASTLRGELVAFKDNTAVVALTEPATIAPGRAVWVVLGIDGAEPARVPASVLYCSEHAGRHCVALELADASGSGQRRHPRVPFSERIEVIGITDRPGPDPRWRGMTCDMSIQGLGAVLTAEIRIGALVLVRCFLPPHRAAFQVRATAKRCVRESADSFRTGFLFERVTAGHAQQLQAAILYLTRERLSAR